MDGATRGQSLAGALGVVTVKREIEVATIAEINVRTLDTAALALQSIALAALAATPLLVQPAIAGHAPGTPDFARLHGISMALNLFSLLAVPVASLLVLARSKE